MAIVGHFQNGSFELQGHLGLDVSLICRGHFKVAPAYPG